MSGKAVRNGSLTVIWRDWDQILDVEPKMVYVSSVNPGEVKVVLNAASEALYFSRSVIPSGKQGTLNDWLKQITYYRHVGLYAYRCDVLKTIAGLPVSALEQLESLEQLRWLEAGHKIYCVVTPFESHCIDTPEDLDRLIKAGFLQRHGGL